MADDFIQELHENYNKYSKLKNERSNGNYHSTPCVQYGHYPGKLLIQFKEEMHVTNNGDMVETILTEGQVLKLLFENNIEVISCKYLGCDVVGQMILFSIPGHLDIDPCNTELTILQKQYDRTFCRVTLCDNLNVNRWELDDVSCDIFLTIICSPIFEDINK